MVCHLLLAPSLVTSQLLPSASTPKIPATRPKPSIPVTIRAQHQEKQGDVYKLTGNVQIDYGVYTISGDEITYDQGSGEINGEGHLVLEGGPNDEHIEAARGTYNVDKETGKFEQVTGSIGLRRRGNRMMLTGPNPFFFTGKTVEKTGPDHYIVNDGSVTTCQLPHPKWRFYAHKVKVDVGRNATIYSTDFRIEGIPVLYLPFATHPVQREPRQSGFLIPTAGHSSTKGYTLGDSFYWAINRSMDLHLGTEYFSRRGWAPQGEFRARPTENSFVDLSSFSVLDRGVDGVKQGGTQAVLNSEAALPHHFRGVADIDYLSSYVFELAFSDVFTQAVNPEVKSDAFLSNTSGSVFLNATTRRYQDYQSTTPGDVVTILHAPGIEIGAPDRQFWDLPFHGSLDFSAEGLSRSEPGFSTAPLLGRFDLNPTLSVPLQFKGWSLRPELSLRDTFYTQQLTPSAGVALTDVGTAISDPLNRKSIETSVELRPPAVERVFDHEFLGRKWKHVIEPRITYDYVTGVENFPHILRFDERDILSDANRVEYAIVNRLYAKRMSGKADDCGPDGMPALLVGAPPPPTHAPWEHTTRTDQQQPCANQPATREIVTWELGQEYFLDPTFGGALVPGRANIFTSTVDLTGIAFLTEPRHLSPLISRLRVSMSPRNDLEWDIDYDFFGGRVNTNTVLFNHHIGLFTLGAGDAFLHAPGQISTGIQAPQENIFNQYRAVLGYGHANKRGFSGAFDLSLDARADQVQTASAQLAYNWDCCGVDVAYRRFSLADIRNENQFRFTFSLANVGAFGNLRRGERLF